MLKVTSVHRFTETKGGVTTEPDLLFSADKNPSAYKDWLSSIPQNPDIISYTLDSLHELVPVRDPARKNLRAAISHYILEKGLWRNCSEPCRTGIKSNAKDSCVCQCHNQQAVNSDCCPTRKGTARVIITVQRAEGLWGDHTTATDGFVKVILPDNEEHRTRVIQNNNDPHWNAVFDLGSRDLTSGNTARFEVWDEDSGWDNDLLGECQKILVSGVNTDVCPLQHGRLFIKWEARCAPSLTGASCAEYQPSPMTTSLKDVFVSRHAHPIPKEMLVKMGVFVDETSSNQSLTHKP